MLAGNKGGVIIMSLTKFIRDVQKIHEAIRKLDKRFVGVNI